MKKIFYGMLGVVLVLLVSCNSEENSLTPQNVAGAGNVSFAISLPTGDPVTYAEIQTAKEKEIQRLDIYQFGEGEDGLLEAVYKQVDLTPATGGFNVSIKVKEDGKKQFFFVANNLGTNNGGVPAIDNLTNGSMKAKDFKKVVTKAVSSTKSLATPLLMFAQKEELDVLPGTPTSGGEIILERIMSRLDIKNYEPYLTITRVRLEQTLNKSYLAHQATGSQKPAGATFITLPEVTLPTAVTAPGSGAAIEFEKVTTGIPHSFYKHVFYPMVSDAVDVEANAPLIIIEGVLFKGDTEREAKVVYKKRLKVVGEPKFLGFERNHRYTLVIEKAIKGKMTANLMVDKWNEETFEVPIEVKTPKTTGFYDSYNYGHGEASYSAGALTVRKDYTGNIYLNVSTNTKWEILPEGAATVPVDGQMAPWIKAVPSNTYWGNTYPQNIIERGLKINCTANTTGQARTIRLLMRSVVEHNKQFVLTVTQNK